MPWHSYEAVPEGNILGQALGNYMYLNIEAVKVNQAYFIITLFLPICFHS